MLSTVRPTSWLRLALALAVSALVLCLGVTSANALARPLDDTGASVATTVAMTTGAPAPHIGAPTLSATPRSTRQREVGRRAPRPTTSQLTGVIREPDASLPSACGRGDTAPALDHTDRSGRDRWHRGAPTRAPPRRR